MKARDLRLLSKEELKSKLEDSRKQLMELEFKRGAQVEKPHLFKAAKKDIARILAILNETPDKSQGRKK